LRVVLSKEKGVFWGRTDAAREETQEEGDEEWWERAGEGGEGEAAVW
jgi:hypothetical protein